MEIGGYTLRPEPERPRRRDWRLGCIGAGFIMADCHLPAYANLGMHASAIAARDETKVRSVAERHGIETVYGDYRALLDDTSLEVVDVAVPPDVTIEVVREAAKRSHLKGLLVQKPLGTNLAQAREIVSLCERAGIVLAVNQNMRYDPAVRTTKQLLEAGALGDPVLATIEMRAIPHWMPWQARQGWVTLRIMSIHHLDTFRYWLGEPDWIHAAVRPDPRTAFDHDDGICLYTLAFPGGALASAWDDVWAGPAREGAAGDIYIRFRVEGTEGTAIGGITWPRYPERVPSPLRFTTTSSNVWHECAFERVWFPDAFEGTLAQLLVALETGTEPVLGGRDNLRTMALVDAAYESARTHTVVELSSSGESS